MLFRVRVMSALVALSLACVVGCGSDDAESPDAAVSSIDAASSAVDGAPSTADAAAMIDAVVTDASPADADVSPDADPNACHSLGFGGNTVTIMQITSLPAMTGGVIPLGAYDATAVTVDATNSLTGTYRGSWYFQTSDRMQMFDQLTLSGTPPTPTPRTLSWSTSGNEMTRIRTCGGTGTFNTTYRVRVEGADTFLDVRTTSVMFTFKKRP